MNKDSALVNPAAGKILKDALGAFPKTQKEVAELLEVSTKQLQNYCKGLFPRYKGDNIRALDSILGTSVHEMLYSSELKTENEVPRESLGPSYLEQRRWGKIVGDEHYAPLIPHKARAGYSRNYENTDYLDSEFETFQIPPGINPRGTEWRWFEVGGNSMEPVLHDGDYLLCSLVAHADWQDIEQFKIYVIVWDNEVAVKRLAMDKGDFVLVSENEAEHKQIRVPIGKVKEIWKLRRQINAKFPPTKLFKITV